ncbi:COBW domain-containing protein C15D4.05, partial [Bienertia sinuspersici]
LANPSSITQTFNAKDAIFNDVKLDGFVTLVDAEHVDYALGIRVFDFERIESVITEESSKEYHDHHNNHDHHLEHKHEHEHEHEHALLALNAGHAHDHTHDPGVSAINIVCAGSLDLDKANMWLGALLLERDDDIYRIKDFYLFRGVHDNSKARQTGQGDLMSQGQTSYSSLERTSMKRNLRRDLKLDYHNVTVEKNI